MKTILAATFLILSLAHPLIAEENVQALIVEAPATWKVGFKGDKSIQFYTAKYKEDNTSLLIHSRSPSTRNVNDIPKMIETFATSVFKTDYKLPTPKYKIEIIDGEAFSGKYIQFEPPGEVCLTVFMIGDTERVWSGTFRGPKMRWTEALSIINKIKKNG